MEKAAERNVKEQESRRALHNAKDISVMKSIVALDNANRVAGGRIGRTETPFVDKRPNGRQIPEQAGRAPISNGGI